MNERWLPIVGYEGRYEVSDRGNVRSLARVVTSKNGCITRRPGIALTATSSGNGYPRVGLCKEGKVMVVGVHRLVLQAFVGQPPSRSHHACHADGNPANPSLANLRWGTVAENAADRLIHGTDFRGEKSPQAKLTWKDVAAIRASTATQRALAAQYGVSQPAIHDVLAGKSWAQQ